MTSYARSKTNSLHVATGVALALCAGATPRGFAAAPSQTAAAGAAQQSNQNIQSRLNNSQ